MPVLSARMIAARSFFLLCLRAIQPLLSLLVRTSQVAWCTHADQVLIIVCTAEFDGHYVVYLDGFALTAPVAVLALPPIAFENARTDRQPSASFHATCADVPCL